MFRASWASLTPVDGEHLVDALGNRISKANGMLLVAGLSVSTAEPEYPSFTRQGVIQGR